VHLVINATEIGRRRGGNESFIMGLLEGLTKLDLPHHVSLLTCQWDTSPPLLNSFHQMNLGNYHRLAFFLWQQTLALQQLKADWYLANFFLPPLMSGQGVVAVHDLSFRAHPDFFPKTVAWYMSWLTGWAVKKARYVLTGSEFSRQELFRFYPVNQDKVITIPYGVGSEFRLLANGDDGAAERATLSRYGVTTPYILALGNIHPRKNLSRLLDAYLCLKRQRDSVPPMVWSGLERWDSGELLERARAAGVVLTGFVAQKDLPALYRQAMMLVYPSLYEGFGLPPLEAMACGTPVVVSNTTSVPEVVEEAGLLVNPNETEEITAAMARFLDDPALHKQFQQAGLEQARKFTWTRTVQELIGILDA